MPDLRMAVLIDADNSSAKKLDAILSQVATVGQANVRRAYGNWTKSELKNWPTVLNELAISPVQQFDLTRGKNASDMAMVIDAMDLMHAGDVDGFAIVSSDADFTPLVMRLRQSGAEVLGFGQAKAPEPFQNACSQFFFLESLSDDDEDPVEEDDEKEPQERVPTKRRTGAELKADNRLLKMLRSAIDDAADDDGWAQLSQISNQIRNQSSFQPRNYGYAKLSGLIDEIDLFELTDDKKAVRRAPRRNARKSTRKSAPKQGS